MTKIEHPRKIIDETKVIFLPECDKNTTETLKFLKSCFNQNRKYVSMNDIKNNLKPFDKERGKELTKITRKCLKPIIKNGGVERIYKITPIINRIKKEYD
jgi:hypothetical protein